MKKKSFFVVLTTMMLSAVALVSVSATPTFAETVTQLLGGSVLSNATSQNALTIMQTGTVGKGRDTGGALLLNNSGNLNTGLTLYSNQATPSQPLARLEIDHTGWDEEVLYIRSDSATSRGLIRLDSPAPEIEFVETDQTGAAGKFEIRTQNDTFQINSRRSDDTTFENKFTFTHGGDLQLTSGVLRVGGTGVSEFKGGINITGGCLAINGKCIAGDATTQSAPSPTTNTTTTTSGPAKAKVVAGAPAATDCNSFSEQGNMSLDTASHRLYVCNGPDRGWDYTSLTN